MNDLTPFPPKTGPLASWTGLPAISPETATVLAYAHDEPSWRLRLAIVDAEVFLAAVQAGRGVAAVAEPIPTDELRGELRKLLTAWPNTPKGDLAGYAVQLAADLEEERPTRHGIEAGFRALRRNSRFVPSIAEVLAAVSAADSVARGFTKLVESLPEIMPDARDALARAERREAEAEARSGHPPADLARP